MIELIIILGVGVVLGMYITSQIKCHIRKNIFNNNIKEYDKKKKKNGGKEEYIQLGLPIRLSKMKKRTNNNVTEA